MKYSYFNIILNHILLIVNMCLSHSLLTTPLFGAVMFLFANVLVILRNDVVRELSGFDRKPLIGLTLIISSASASAFALYFPDMIGFQWYISIVFLFSNIIVLMLKEKMFSSFQQCVNYEIKINYNSPSSLKIYHNMMFFSRLSLLTGVLMIISNVSFKMMDFSFNQYVSIFLGILIVGALYVFFVNIFKLKPAFSLFIFIAGAVLWIIASFLFFRSSSFANVVSLLLFLISLSFINSSLSRYNSDFNMVLKFVGEEETEVKMSSMDYLNIQLSSLLSACIMILIVTLWSFVMPYFDAWKSHDIFSGLIIQIPAFFMMISIFYALNQPLDARVRDKLSNYFLTSGDTEMNRSLYRMLIRKYRVRYGVKIIATFVRPWLHLKVKGVEGVRNDLFPSVFVCNHGIIYGPVAAVIYLPTYFRPWIDKKMLDVDMAAEEMYSRFMYRMPFFTENVKKLFARWLARPVVWAMNSFNPIGVERDNLRNVMTTFNDTIKALKESDNILLFPERPAKKVVSGKETAVHTTDSVGNLFKGFAKLGNMYWKETGKRLAFYPIYADKEKHTFTIGEAVIYEPNNNVNDERDRIAEELKRRMDLMTSDYHGDFIKDASLMEE